MACVLQQSHAEESRDPWYDLCPVVRLWCIVLRERRMAPMLQTLATQTEPEVMHTLEDRALAVWQERYPDRWL